MSGPKVENLFDKYIRPLNCQLVGQPAEKVINYYDDAYGNTTQLSVLTNSKLEEKFRNLQLTHKQEEALRYQFSALGRLGQVLFEKKFAAAAQQ